MTRKRIALLAALLCACESPEETKVRVQAARTENPCSWNGPFWKVEAGTAIAVTCSSDSAICVICSPPTHDRLECRRFDPRRCAP